MINDWTGWQAVSELGDRGGDDSTLDLLLALSEFQQLSYDHHYSFVDVDEGCFHFIGDTFT